MTISETGPSKLPPPSASGEFARTEWVAELTREQMAVVSPPEPGVLLPAPMPVHVAASGISDQNGTWVL